VICGCKSTLLKHLVTDSKCAVIVNNTDTTASESCRTIDLGCVCCTARDDLVDQVSSVCNENKYDHLIIECSEDADPAEVAVLFGHDEEEFPNGGAKLDALVTVVDATSFFENVNKPELFELTIRQIEYANIIVLSKTDVLNQEQMSKIHNVLESLNPDSKRINMCDVDTSTVLGTGLYNESSIEDNAGWLHALENDAAVGNSHPEFGITCYTFRSRKPFDPQSFHDLFYAKHSSATQFGCIIRSKGFVWIASNHNGMVEWNQAGDFSSLQVNMPWLVTVPDMWKGSEQEDKILKDMVEPFGDRRQEIVFLGQNLNVTELESVLNRCLLTDESFLEGPDAWCSKFTDPFV